MAKKRSPRPKLNPEAIAALDRLYEQLPKAQCIGACWDSCGPIEMTPLEHWRIKAAGFDIPNANAARDGLSVCPALTLLHQCAVYESRPLICRLWGVMETMPCNYGCQLDGPPLTDRQAHEFIAQVHDIAGEHAEAEMIRRPWLLNPGRAEEVAANYHQALRDEDLREQVRLKKLIESGQTVFYVRGRGHISSTPPPSGANS
jgi:Fe-S-cluster containining protein